MNFEIPLDKPWVVAEAIQSAFQAPFYHVIIEVLLLLWIIRLIFFKSVKIYEKDPPTAIEREELIRDWKPEPLVPPLEETLSESTPYRVVTGRPGKLIEIDGRRCRNFATMNFLGLLGNERIDAETEKCIRKYGVGSCGPRGFYGTFDVHLELEERLAKYIGAEEAIIYSYGFATVASAIPAYSKRGDVIFVDEAVCFAVQKGLQASRSKIVYFKHNDMADLEEKLKEQERIDKKDPKKAAVVRKFMVVEGLYMNTGNICDLPRLVELKFKYKVRLFIEESLSFGVLGQNGRGVTEHFDIPISKVDLVSASLEYSLASTGGFCCGRKFVINHQRLSGLGYVFSASLPPLLARAAIEGLNVLEENPETFPQLHEKAAYFQDKVKEIDGIRITGYPESPVFHILISDPVSPEADRRFMQSIVDESAENGVCFTIASRLRHNEASRDWPVSIRVAVTIEMSRSDLDNAVLVLKQAVETALKNSKT